MEAGEVRHKAGLVLETAEVENERGRVDAADHRRRKAAEGGGKRRERTATAARPCRPDRKACARDGFARQRSRADLARTIDHCHGEGRPHRGGDGRSEPLRQRCNIGLRPRQLAQHRQQLRQPIGYLRFMHAISFERLARLMFDLFGLTISEGALVNLLADSRPGVRPAEKADPRPPAR